ncbi:MAG: hypothetical protein CM15mP46_1100 [Alphaproteobacteria bacterium]|nr:MAG: hypothetical protein CM15mP46_1100 [Alphaproteobacteria bacterium]
MVCDRRGGGMVVLEDMDHAIARGAKFTPNLLAMALILMVMTGFAPRRRGALQGNWRWPGLMAML